MCVCQLLLLLMECQWESNIFVKGNFFLVEQVVVSREPEKSALKLETNHQGSLLLPEARLAVPCLIPHPQAQLDSWGASSVMEAPNLPKQ